MRRVRFLALLAMLPACGGGGGSGDGGGAVPRLAAFEAALRTDGFQLTAGRLAAADLNGCCEIDRSCFGNNPTSPYLYFEVPDETGATVGFYRLRDDEALVAVFTTPPPCAYFGITPYLFDRFSFLAAERQEVFASLSESLNLETIAVEGGPGLFGRTSVVIATADAGTDARVRAALVAAGYAAGSINTVVFDPALGRFGLEPNDDTFHVLLRVALADPGSEAAMDAYVAAPPFTLWRVTPNTFAPTPLPSPLPRAKNTASTEAAFAATVGTLRAALIARHAATHDATDIPVNPNGFVPLACIATTTTCLGDNRDTNYPGTGVFTWPLFDDEFVVVYGVNHEATGKATYSNASVYGVDHAVGTAAVDSRAFAGSADDLLPGDPAAGNFYAWKFARANPSADPHCTVISGAPCPVGLDPGESIRIAFRTYVEPGFATAPDIDTIVLDRVLIFRRKP